ncbi:MAG TPA: SdrD B-like domain-containing protein, partial [Phototrophicaceae bacterium]|nr:SdrD B-like domain-containing protein [Phototrophicaceae bacterium]
MPNPVDYIITYTDDSASLTGTLQLGAGEQTEIRAGYGEPVFNAGDYQVPLGESCPAPGQLDGIVWNDVNGDGRYIEDDLGVPEVVVVLMDVDGEVVEAITSKTGRYHFPLLKPGQYTVQVKLETLPRGMLATYDVDGESDSLAAVTVIGAETAVADFGYKPTGAIAGRVWNDADGDGLYGEAETGI